MASQSEDSVSVELGKLLELLNALDVQDSRPEENFAALERLLAAGKTSPAASLSGDHLPDDDPSEAAGGVAGADQPSSSEELIAERLERRDDERPEAEIENRLAVYIVQGMRKSIKDWTL